MIKSQSAAQLSAVQVIDGTQADKQWESHKQSIEYMRAGCYAKCQVAFENDSKRQVSIFV